MKGKGRKVGAIATYNGGPLFQAEVCIWIRGKLAMSEGVEFALCQANFLFVIGR